MRTYLLPVLLLIVASLVAYPRLHRQLARYQQTQTAQASVARIAPKLHNGDLIFQTSQSAQSKAIQLATHSPYSHCGILFQKNGEWRVFEAVQPVSETSLTAWAARGKDGKVVVKRLRDAKTVLTPATLQRLKAAGEQYRGKNYDLYFGWSDDRIYCSELLWKMYQQATGREIGKLQTLREFDLGHPAVRAKLQERYGKRIPLNEKVISPVQMFESQELVTVQ
ncbi:Permuted papain-like amidase enzyme, YaeF/YiiX, C92 family [Hymenobacter gelipurpurascens]|uniref:Permuted papain-like amidase enzyme, YaeF/YiiX, C92 family n=1 Tax=Hymenobacter gelipurpurascens TaxID=89968 RepID=A0A212TM10_9BACT|nr:YiiX family permuted papain-like enzyme [Hymenobacter gelipurpurascens]SNC67077.1 Permuted papain-like amidase enzyme, YaeF/YiiX, C92 family [Hymenobacter gelipurpurascens]